MQVVFRDSVNEAVQNGILPLAVVCLRELGGLPFNILREFWHEFKRKEMTMAVNKRTEPSSIMDVRVRHGEAWIAALPFMLFGMASMIGKIKLPFLGAYADLAFYAIVLLGLFIGLIRAFPRWAFSYLGWTLVFAWWWTNMHTEGLKIFGYTMHNEAWGWRIWFPLIFTIGLALLWTRSIRPLRQLVRGIWEDWTLLSLAVYALVGFMMVLYDESHSPYLIAFMIVSTSAISASVWIFMRSMKTHTRVIALLSGFVTGILLDRISESTWDVAAYYGFSPRPSMPWYDPVLDVIVITAFWGVILLLPALLGFVRHAVRTEGPGQPPALKK
jgi:hypothetical protein